MRGGAIGWAVGVVALGVASSAGAADGDVLVELHYKPVGDAQIAVWIEDGQGNFVQDVFVTQTTGTLGLGNRPGRWDFLSSWRFPYGPRPQVLPVWAHARGRMYPKLVWFDDDETYQDSLGFHESTSSAEPYYCRPLTPSEHETISTDTMTCPSPGGFSTDKGRFSAETSVYPPRGDLIAFTQGKDHTDIKQFDELNDLDAVSGATPVGNTPAMLTTMIPAAAAQQPLVAWIEINTQYDENPSYAFDRDDHYVDPHLSGYGVPYFGQPSVVYRVDFDPQERAFWGTDAYAGYGDFDGTTGQINPPDATISVDAGSGADRLQLFTKNGATFRFGVYSHGDGTGGGDSGWGECELASLPAMNDVELEPLGFDRVRVHFTVPSIGDEIRNVVLYYRQGDMALTADDASSAVQSIPGPGECGGDIGPGVTTWCDLDELFGSTEYQVGVVYVDSCSNRSDLVAASVTTPRQEFATVEGMCFVATAAWGAPWATQVQALRWFRDLYLKSNSVGYAFVLFYYAHSPAAARFIARYPLARSFAQVVLAPLANTATLLTAPAPD